jgi:chromosome segregation ATPase
MTTLDDAERQLDAALTRLEGVVGRLSAWQETEAAAERRAAEAQSEASRRIEQAEMARAAALAERDAVTGEHQVLRERCDALGRELAECRAMGERAAADAAARIGDLESSLADKTAERDRLTAELRQMEAEATREVARLDNLCEQLGAQLTTAKVMADRLGAAARSAVDSLQDALGAGDRHD